MKKMSKFILLLTLIFSFSLMLSACDTEDVEPTPGGQVTPETHSISVGNITGGTVTSSVTSAKTGETVTLIVTPNFGYELVNGSLKANSVLVENNSFIMPNEDVVITAEFKVTGSELTVPQTNLEFVASSGNIDATAHISTSFTEGGLEVSAVVEDSNILIRGGIEKSDGLRFYFSENVVSDSYIEGVYLVDVLADGTVNVSKHDGTNFTAVVDSNISIEVSLFSNNSVLGGYALKIVVPYSLFDLEFATAKGNILMCPVLFNSNVASSIIPSTSATPTEFDVVESNPNSFLVLVDDNEYGVNENAIPGYYFKNTASFVENGQYWDISLDTSTSSGEVKLTGHDSADNHLLFNVSSTEFMYARATIKLTDYLLKGDQWLKFGVALFDGSVNQGVFYYVDAAAGGTAANHIDLINGNTFGVHYIRDGFTKWNGLDTIHTFDLTTKSITLELVYDNGSVYLYSDGNLVNASYYQPISDDLRIAIKNFGFGCTVTNYYCTEDRADTEIADVVAVLDASKVVEEYGLVDNTTVKDHVAVKVNYSAVCKEEGTYIKAVLNTPTLPTSQGDDNGWYNWTNFEFMLNGDKQLYFAIQGNMNTHYDAYNVVAGRYVTDLSASIEQLEDGTYNITFNAFCADLPQNSTIRLNWFVIDGVRNTPALSTTYIITSEGLVTPENASYVINVDDTIANGSISADLESAKPNATVTLSAIAADGYRLAGFIVNGELIDGNTFVMPVGAVTVSAVFVEVDLNAVTFTVEGSNGTATISHSSAEAGEVVEIDLEVERGYKARVYLDGEILNGTSFEMPAKDVIVNVVIENDPTSGFVFVNKNDLTYGSGWDLTNDTATENGVVTLDTHDALDNRLFFNVSSTNFMYAKAKIEVTSVLLLNDQWLKFGMAIYDDKSNGAYYYIDAYKSNASNNDVSAIDGDGFGTVYRVADAYYNWTPLVSDVKFNTVTKTITLELVFDNNQVFFFADGKLVTVSYYQPTTNNPYIGLINFGYGCSVSDYYCTEDKNDVNIAATVDKIVSAETNEYGKVVSTTINGTSLPVNYSAIYKEEGIYLTATVGMENLPTIKGSAGWFDNTNFEFLLNGVQLFFSIPANMYTLDGAFEVFHNNKDISSLVASVTKNSESGLYELNIKCLISGAAEYSTIKLNWFVIDAIRNSALNSDEYLVSSEGLILPQDRKYSISINKEIENGSIAISSESAKAGEEVTLEATPNEGYELVSFTVDGVSITGSSFLMSSKDVVIGAVFVEKGTTTKVESVEINGATEINVAEGSSVTLTATVNANVSVLSVNWSSSNEEVATVVDGVVTFKLVDADTTVTITATSVDDETKSDSVTFTVIRQHRFDGTKDDALWTTEVLANGLVVNKPDNEVLITLYATRDNNGVYFFADYQVLEPHISTDWWRSDNVELRIINTTGMIINPKAGNSYQFYASTGDGHTVTTCFVSEPVKNDSTGYYDIKFEMFVSYTDLGVTANDLLGVTLGSNPGGDGWYCTNPFDPVTLLDANKILVSGIHRYYPEDNCPVVDHQYGEFTVTTNATCSENGSKERYCQLCNHKDVVVIESTGEHVYDESNPEVVIASTCQVAGSGKAHCGCGEYKEIQLPLDPHNHGDNWSEDTGCSECNLLDSARSQSLTGWNSLVVNLSMDGTASWEVAFNVNVKHNSSSNEWGHSMVAEVFSPNWSNGGWTFRTDWWGWGAWTDGGKASYTDINNGTWYEKYFEASNDMNIVGSIKYDAIAKTITVTMTYISNVDPYSAEVKYLTYVCTDISYSGEMLVGIGGNICDINIKNVSIVSGSGKLN